MTEYKRGQDDIYDVEFHIENAHQSKNPNPTEREGQKGYQTEFEPTQGEQQEDKNDETADVEDIIEVIRQGGDHAAGHRLSIKGDGGGVAIVQGLFYGRSTVGVKIQEVDNHRFFGPLKYIASAYGLAKGIEKFKPFDRPRSAYGRIESTECVGTKAQPRSLFIQNI